MSLDILRRCLRSLSSFYWNAAFIQESFQVRLHSLVTYPPSSCVTHQQGNQGPRVTNICWNEDTGTCRQPLLGKQIHTHDDLVSCPGCPLWASVVCCVDEWLHSCVELEDWLPLPSSDLGAGHPCPVTSS